MKIICFILLILNLSATDLYRQEKDGLYGYVDANRDWKIKAQFDKALAFKGKHALVQVNKKWGMIDTEGYYDLEPLYDSLTYPIHGLVLAKKADLYGYLDPSGSIQIDFKFKQAYAFEGPLARIREGKKWNLINREGQKIWPKAVDSIKRLKLGLYLVKRGKSSGLTSLKGKELLAINYQNIQFLSSHTALLKNKEDRYELYALKEAKKEDYQEIKILKKEGLILAKKDNKWAILDRYARELIRPSLDEILDFKEGYAVFRVDETYGFLNKKGAIQIPPNYEQAQSFRSGKALVQENGKWIFINSSGEDLAVLKEKQEKLLAQKEALAARERLLKAKKKASLAKAKALRAQKQANDYARYEKPYNPSISYYSYGTRYYTYPRRSLYRKIYYNKYRYYRKAPIKIKF